MEGIIALIAVLAMIAIPLIPIWLFLKYRKSKNNKLNEVKKEHEFTTTRVIGKYLEIDDNNKKIHIRATSNRSRKFFDFKEIVKFELLQDGESITKGGLAAALGGAMLAGSVGAVVGSVVGKKKNEGICTQLLIKLTVNDPSAPAVYINFIKSKTEKKSLKYRKAFEAAQLSMSALQLICDEQVERQEIIPQESATKQLKEFKDLLDMGAITEDEYAIKKQQLLNI